MSFSITPFAVIIPHHITSQTWREYCNGGLSSSSQYVVKCKHPVRLNTMLPQHVTNLQQITTFSTSLKCMWNCNIQHISTMYTRSQYSIQHITICSKCCKSAEMCCTHVGVYSLPVLCLLCLLLCLFDFAFLFFKFVFFFVLLLISRIKINIWFTSNCNIYLLCKSYQGTWK